MKKPLKEKKSVVPPVVRTKFPPVKTEKRTRKRKQITDPDREIILKDHNKRLSHAVDAINKSKKDLKRIFSK